MMKKRSIRELYSINKVTEEVFCTNEYGFVMDAFSNQTGDSNQGIKSEWYALITECDGDRERLRKNKQAKYLIYRGIPLSLKYKLWSILTKKSIKVDYASLIVIKSGYEHQIHVDVQRTFRKHFLFNKEYGRGQCELFNVLAAYSNYNPDVGYCQGMSSAAALLLMYFPEEEAFEMLVGIISSNCLETLFDKKLSKVPSLQKAQNQVFEKLIPEIHRHMRIQGVDMGVYAIGWYLTLFTRFDIKLVLRMWDFFIFFDFSVFVLFAAAILRFFSKRILDLDGEQLIEFIGMLDAEPVEVDEIVSYVVESLEMQDISIIENVLR
ncbi:putative GTPase-activating protein [Ordospora colligata]|uniref:Putative GTPase-activating protein n=1 Tax=Ordospora colligata OC4 TaxID=1354746 RepID=A0A0B2UIX5_9MICR|nr:putative GTPase-activating protein [Ordospora colligata OC4]KHN68935.1 putative GTPase-activating protein [Ordospora colligata OC4]TBU13969.1 putative GTPase-activating protein [Ordospora colligata]TBU14158.1 putative GTPase-activating protein [Ordospora colligata]TBU17827.1 putative GTPase-activating protein [Ordospora colligata]